MFASKSHHLRLCALVISCIYLLGCKPSDPGAAKQSASSDAKHDDHDHHDHHDDDHDAGVHGGHLLTLSAAGETAAFQAEWLHDEKQGVISVYLLDDGKVMSEGMPAEVSIDV